MQTPQLLDWLTLAAIFLGPLVGIWVTRVIDNAKERGKRREAVFEGLVRTRGLELSPDHVSNLNMVPFLFKEQPVREAYSRTMTAFSDAALGSSDPKVVEGAVARMNAARQDLIRTIGEAVGSPLPTNELERLGYAPQAWARQQIEQDQLRALLIEWMEGKRATNMIAGVWEVPATDPPADPEPKALPKKPGK